MIESNLLTVFIGAGGPGINHSPNGDVFRGLPQAISVKTAPVTGSMYFVTFRGFMAMRTIIFHAVKAYIANPEASNRYSYQIAGERMFLTSPEIGPRAGAENMVLFRIETLVNIATGPSFP